MTTFTRHIQMKTTYKTASSPSTGHEFHVGPHLMIIGPHQDELQAFNRDGSNGMPYVTHLPNRTELFLVMPIRQWDEQLVPSYKHG
jgi:hypothetical protein